MATLDLPHRNLGVLSVASLRRLGRAVGRREKEIFLAGSGLAAAHAANVGAWIPFLLLVGLATVYARLAASVRAAIAAVVAPLAFFGGLLHVLHVRWDGLGRGDLTGLLLFAAGGLLLVAASAALFARPR